MTRTVTSVTQRGCFKTAWIPRIPKAAACAFVLTTAVACGGNASDAIGQRQDGDISSPENVPPDRDVGRSADLVDAGPATDVLPECEQVDPSGSTVVDVLRLGSVWRSSTPIYYEGLGTVQNSEFSYMTVTLTEGDIAGVEIRVSASDGGMMIPGMMDGDTVQVTALGTDTTFGQSSPSHTVIRSMDGVPILAAYSGKRDGTGLAELRDDWPFDIELRDACQFTPVHSCPTEPLSIRYGLVLGDASIEVVDGETKPFTVAGVDYVAGVAFAERTIREADPSGCNDGVGNKDRIDFTIVRAAP